MADDSVNYSGNEYSKYQDIVVSINTDKNLFIRKILYYFKFDKLLNNQDALDDTKFKYLLGYIPNENIEYGNSEFIKFLTTPILIFAIFILIAVPQIPDNNTPKVGLFWLVIIVLYLCYTVKHCLFISKLCLQFNTFLEYNLYKDKFRDFLNTSNTTFFWYLVYNSDFTISWSQFSFIKYFLSFLWIFVTYVLLKISQIAIIPVILFLIIFYLNYHGDIGYKISSYVLLALILLSKIASSLYIMKCTKDNIRNYYYTENSDNKTQKYNEEYDTYHTSVYKWMIVPHKLFSGGDSAFSSYLFTKTFTLIFGILMFIIGIPIYSIVLSITLLYVSLNFIYNIIIFPLTKPETREKIFEIIKENGSLLALLFTGLTINSIYQSHIFGDRNKQIIGIMCAVYAILVLMHLGRKNLKKDNTE